VERTLASGGWIQWAISMVYATVDRIELERIERENDQENQRLAAVAFERLSLAPLPSHQKAAA